MRLGWRRPVRVVGQRPVWLGLVLAVSVGWADRAQDLANLAAQVQRERCQSVTTLSDCHDGFPTGCSNAQNPAYDAYLNFLKNQMLSPSVAPGPFLDQTGFAAKELAIPAGLRSRNHGDHAQALAGLGEGNIHGVIGFLYYAQVTRSPETANCQLTGTRNSDFHIGIGFDAGVAQRLRAGEAIAKRDLERTSIIAEMTPHYRRRHRRDWTISLLRLNAGRQVKVIGQLMLDNEHLEPAENCGRPNADLQTCFRLSGWEIHPVSEFFVCQGGNACAQDSSDWVRIDQ